VNENVLSCEGYELVTAALTERRAARAATREAQAQRDSLQQELDRARIEIERLKGMWHQALVRVEEAQNLSKALTMALGHCKAQPTVESEIYKRALEDIRDTEHADGYWARLKARKVLKGDLEDLKVKA